MVESIWMVQINGHRGRMSRMQTASNGRKTWVEAKKRSIEVNVNSQKSELKENGTKEEAGRRMNKKEDDVVEMEESEVRNEKEATKLSAYTPENKAGSYKTWTAH